MNAAKCLRCGDVLVSRYRHDFQGCSCGNLFVDGGEDYVKRSYGDAPELIVEITTQAELDAAQEDSSG